MAACLVVDASFAFRLLLPGPEQAAFQGRARQWMSDGSELYAPTLAIREDARFKFHVSRRFASTGALWYNLFPEFESGCLRIYFQEQSSKDERHSRGNVVFLRPEPSDVAGEGYARRAAASFQVSSAHTHPD